VNKDAFDGDKKVKDSGVNPSSLASSQNSENTTKTPTKRKRVYSLAYLDKLYQKRFDSLIKQNEQLKEMLSAFKDSKRTYLRMKRLENSSYDMSWIDAIEYAIPSLDEIIRNPKINTKNIYDIVPIELAKKTGSESIIHLSSHSQFVKEITPEGEVIPKKILEIGTDNDYITYENKFIATLIRRLMLFVEKRYLYITKYSPLKDYDILYSTHETNYQGNDIKVETKVSLARPRQSGEQFSQASKYIEKINFVRKYTHYFFSSDFMKMFKNERDVKAPIIQTNILRKNPRYRKCYQLYRFMERYDKLGVNFTVKEEYQDLSSLDMQEIDKLALASLLSLKPEEAIAKDLKKKVRSYKPKLLSNYDDDLFIFYPHEEDPEFIRVDEEYLKYKEKEFSSFPIHPTKKEASIYKESYAKKKSLKKEEKAIDKLLRRKMKVKKVFDKDQVKLKVEVEKEETRKALEKAKAEEKRKQDELNAVRTYIKEEATKDKGKLKSDKEEGK
jgi:hypothetical protein